MKLHITVRAHTTQQKIERLDEAHYKVFLKKRAEDNKANEELVKLLQKKFSSPVKILRGKTSKHKIVEVKCEKN